MRSGRTNRRELRNRPINGLAAALAATLILAACSGGEPTGQNRLVVVDGIREVFTMQPDGSDRISLGRTSGTNILRQPTWSPDGDEVAWVEVGDGGALLHVARFDGESGRSVPIEASPFYLFWSPSGDRILALGSPPGGSIEANLIEVGDLLTVALFDVGQPFYYDWSPDGRQLITQIGGSRLAIQDFDGSVDRVIEAAPSVFQAPAWVGERLVYGSAGQIRSSLVVEDAEAEDAETVLEFDGFISFDVAGDRIAYLVTSTGAVEASFQRTPTAAPGVLSVLDLASGEIAVASRGRVVAFAWSPNGERLLSLEVAEGGRVHWSVWENGDSIEFAPFRPSSTDLRSYLSFFDQYARSETPWSPRSDAFAYAGTAEDGRRGIWVQSVSPNSAPVLVADGDHVGWGS
jgi:Tol biopolymer transport system component